MRANLIIYSYRKMRSKRYMEDDEFGFQDSGKVKRPQMKKILNIKGDDMDSPKNSYKKSLPSRASYTSSRALIKKKNILEMQPSLTSIPALISTKIKRIFKKREKYQEKIAKINNRIYNNKVEIRSLKAKIYDEEMKNTSLDGKKLIQAKNSEIYLEIFPFRVPQSYDQSLTKDLGLEDTSSRIRCYNSVAYSTFTEVGIKLASQVKTYFYYEVLDGNHTFFSKKYEWKPNGEFQDQLKGTKFNWKIKTGNESIKIRLYSETVAQTNSSVSSKLQYDIDARVIGEVEFSLK